MGTKIQSHPLCYSEENASAPWPLSWHALPQLVPLLIISSLYIFQRGERERSPASLLARTGACLALPQLVPLLVTSNADLLHTMLQLLTSGLPCATKDEGEPPLLQVSSLYAHKYSHHSR